MSHYSMIGIQHSSIRLFLQCPITAQLIFVHHFTLHALFVLLFFATMSDTPFANLVYPTVDHCHAILYETISLLLLSSNPHPATSALDDLKGRIQKYFQDDAFGQFFRCMIIHGRPDGPELSLNFLINSSCVLGHATCSSCNQFIQP